MSEELYELENRDDEQQSETKELTRRAKKGLRFVRVLLLFIMSVTAITVLIINKDKINVDNLKRLAAKIELGVSTNSDIDNSVIDFDYNSTGKVRVYKDGIARVTDDNLVILDNIGTEFQSVLTGYTDPQIITGAKYVCVYDRGDKKLMVTDSFSVVFEHTFKDNIVTASMNDSGYIAVVTQSEAYKNHVVVFDSSFKEVYKINSLTRYIIDADVSPDSKRVVVSSLYSQKDQLIPQINSYDLSSEKIKWTASFSDSVAVDVCLKSDGTAVALFDWGFCFLNKDGKEVSRYEFGNNILQHYAVNKGKTNVAVISSSRNGASKIVVLNNEGEQVSSFDLDFSVLSVDTLSDKVAVLSHENIFVYNKKGKLLSKRKCDATVNEVYFSDSDSVVTVSASHVVYNIMK